VAEPLRLPTPLTEATSQVAAARDILNADYTGTPRPPWGGVVGLTGPGLPGELWVIGARTGCGKTTFLLNWFQHLVVSRVPVLYLGTECPAADLRRRWAAWVLGYSTAAVLENDWARLPPDAKERIDRALQEQQDEYHDVALFGDAPDLDPQQLVEHLKIGRRRRVQVVILDHIHRVRLGGDSRDQTYLLSQATRFLKQWAVKTGVLILVGAQLNRAERVPLADLAPPPLSSLKQSGTLEEESDVVLLLHRTRRPDATPEELHAVMRNERPISDIIAPRTMCVRIGKHRRRGEQVDHVAFLHVDERGGLTDRAPQWRPEDPR